MVEDHGHGQHSCWACRRRFGPNLMVQRIFVAGITCWVHPGCFNDLVTVRNVLLGGNTGDSMIFAKILGEAVEAAES